MIDLRRVTRSHVYVRGRLAGRFEKIATDAYRFSYDRSYIENAASSAGTLPPASLTLPFPGPYTADHVLPFFDNLIVEGWLLERIARTLKLDKSDRFALLMATGRQASGAVQIVPVDDSGHELLETSWAPAASTEPYLDVKGTEPLIVDGEPHTWQALASPFDALCPSCLDESPGGELHRRCGKALWGTSRAVHILLPQDDASSLFVNPVKGQGASGAQRKGLFYLTSNARLVRQTPHWSGAYIVKPDGAFPEFPANEHVTMLLASRWHVAVPPRALFKIDGLGLLYVTRRFDWLGPRGEDRRLMEDFAQLCGMTSAEKSHGDMEALARTIERYTTAPVIEKAELFRRVLFCHATANADMHLKNWAIVETGSGDYELSPAYDLTNTRIALGTAETIDINLPLFGRQDGLTGADFRRYGREVLGLAQPVIRRDLDDLETLRELAHDYVPRSSLSDRRKTAYLQLVDRRVAALRSKD